MNGNWRERGKVENFAPTREVLEIRPQQYGTLPAPGNIHKANGAPVMGKSSANSNMITRANAAQQGSTARDFRRQGPPAAVKPLGTSHPIVNAGSPMTDAQQVPQFRGPPQKGPPVAGMFHVNNSQHISMSQASTYAPPPNTNPFRTDFNNGVRTNGQARTFVPSGQAQRRPMPKSMYQKGVIVRALHYEEDFDGGSGKSFRGPNAAADMAKTLTKTVTGEWLYSKYRKFIVVSLQGERYVALPLYTHNGEGLTGSHIDPDEHVSVQDHRAAPIMPLSRHAPVHTLELENHVRLYHEKTTAHLGDPVPRRYCHPVVYEGRLDEDSTRHLVRLWQHRMNL